MVRKKIMAGDVLPDSRLIDPNRDVVIADWPYWDAQGVLRKIRLQLQPIYCLNCGVRSGYVPREIMSFVSWLCLPCSEKFGAYAEHWRTSDQEFWDAVAAEMLARFGRVLTQAELDALADQGRLGRGLELLERESPYEIWNGG